MTKNLSHSRSRIKRALTLVGGGVLLFIFLVLVFLLQPAYATPAETITFAKETVAQQEKISEGLRAYYQAGNYTFDDPMVIQNPYRTAPLTALLIFDTPQDSQISIHVPGKAAHAAVDYTFPGYQQHHEIPIYGLYAEMLNHVTVRMETQSGEAAQSEVDLQTEPLPVYMQRFQINQVNPDKYSPGFNFSFADQKPIFDLNGDVRWYSTQSTFRVLTRLTNGRFLFTLDDHNLKLILEMDLLGKIYAIYNVPGGIHHDVIELPTGNLLVTSTDPKSDTIEDIIIEIDRKNGHFVRYFDLKRYLDATRQTVIGMNATDWAHINSITYDPTDQTIIISSRNQSAVFKMTYPGMQLKWILGPHDNWGEKYQPYLLTPIGENFEWSWAQHHATLYSPDIPGDNIIDILLFDNGPYRSFDLATANSPLEWYSRVVHYQVNEEAMTVKQVWEYGKERGSAIFTAFRGSAYMLDNGDVLGTWGAIAKDAQGVPLPTIKSTDVDVSYESKIIEVDPSNNEVVFEVTSAGTYAGYSEKNVFTYRAMRAGLYDGYSEKNNITLTSLNDTTRNDLFDRAVMAWQDVKRWSNTVPLLLWIKRIGRRILSLVT